jgi:hypothetical protein
MTLEKSPYVPHPFPFKQREKDLSHGIGRFNGKPERNLQYQYAVNAVF